MAVSAIDFDPQKALAALMYLVRGGTGDLYKLMKMLYVADKLHLEKSGRFLAGDRYVAMEQGATPSGAYDLVKFVRGDHRIHRGFPEVVRYFRVENRNTLILTAPVPEDDLSPLARESLDRVIEIYRLHPDWPYWWRQAHDTAWNESLRDDADAPPMDIRSVARTILNNEALLEHLADPYPEIAEG